MLVVHEVAVSLDVFVVHEVTVHDDVLVVPVVLLRRIPTRAHATRGRSKSYPMGVEADRWFVRRRKRAAADLCERRRNATDVWVPLGCSEDSRLNDKLGLEARGGVPCHGGFSG